MRPDEPTVSEEEIHAFVDDQLPLVRRAEVEAMLARDPELAARVMADLSGRDALRAALGAAPAASPRVRAAAARLERSFLRRKLGVVLQRAAAVALLVGAGWVGHSLFGGVRESVAAHVPPAFVDDAVQAFRTSEVRAELGETPTVKAFDPTRLEQLTGITLPELPRHWRLADVQVFPTSSGQSVEVMAAPAGGGRLFLYATRTDRFDVIRPQETRTDAGFTVYWQVGEAAYALAGDLPPKDMEREAMRLASSFY